MALVYMRDSTLLVYDMQSELKQICNAVAMSLLLMYVKTPADAPCAKECTRQVYPREDDFASCYACAKAHTFNRPDLGSVEIVFTINYTRSSLLLGGVQSSLSTTCVSLFQQRGMQVNHNTLGWKLFGLSAVQSCMQSCIYSLNMH